MTEYNKNFPNQIQSHPSRVSSLVSRKPVLIHYTPLLSSPSISPAAAHGRIPQNPTLPPAAQPPAESLPVVVSDKPCRRVKRRYPPVVLAGLVTPSAAAEGRAAAAAATTPAEKSCLQKVAAPRCTVFLRTTFASSSLR